MKTKIFTFIIIASLWGSPPCYPMDKTELNPVQQAPVFGMFPFEIWVTIFRALTPQSGGYIYRYTQEESNLFIATFASLRGVCTEFKNFITVPKFAELCTHEELSNIYYNKICTYKLNTRWLSLIAKSVGPNVQCPSCLLSDWATAKDKKFPDNKIPREYFLVHFIHDTKEPEDVVLAVVKTLVDAGTKVTFSGIERDEWLFTCFAHGSPLWNAIAKRFPSVITFLVEHGAPIDNYSLNYAKMFRPEMYELLTKLEKPGYGCPIQ
jgi:hypothetical protein